MNSNPHVKLLHYPRERKNERAILTNSTMYFLFCDGVILWQGVIVGNGVTLWPLYCPVADDRS